MLVIHDAHLMGQPGTVDILVAEHAILDVAPAGALLESESTEHVYAEGDLVTPAFVNPHLHIDKALLARKMAPNAGQTLQEAVQLTWDFKRQYTVSDLLARGLEVVESALSWGTTAIRAFADVDPIGGLRPVEGLLALKERVADWVDLEVVAFPQEGIVRAPGTEALMREAMRMGASVVGGLPWYEWDDQAMRRHVDIVMEIAQEFHCAIHVLADDTDNPNSRSLEYLALRTLESGWSGRVAASHCGALAAYDDVHAAKVIQLVREAGVAIVSNPHISLVLAGRLDREPIRRGITRVKELLAAGVVVASGQDDILDPYYPFGKANQAEVAAYMAHTAQLTLPHEIDRVFGAVTTAAAQVVGISKYGMAPGCRPDLVVHFGADAAEVLRWGLPPRAVIRRGRVAVRNRWVRQGPALEGWQ